MQNLTTRQSSRETVSTISSKGQVTLPVEEPTGNVKVTHVKYPDIQSLRGVAGTLKQPLSLQEIREIAREDRLTNKYGK